MSEPYMPTQACDNYGSGGNSIEGGSGMSDLINVAAEIRRLERVISDKEWEDQDPRSERQELEHYHALARQGVLWEPMF